MLQVDHMGLRRSIFPLISFVFFVILRPPFLLAQDINTLQPDASITTESPDVVVIKTPTMQEIERPSMDVIVIPQTPYLDYNNFSPEFIRNLKEGQLKNAVRLGLLPANTELRFFASPRSAQEDLELYSFTIFLHQRAIKEGKDVNFYIEEVKAGRIPIARLKKDVEVCGTGFELYEGSGICNQFPTHVSAEQNYYHCSLNNYQLLLENADLKRQLEVRNIPDFKDGANKGNLWKPIADPKASCSGGTTVLLDQKYNAPSINLQILDSSFKGLKELIWRLDNLTDGRPRFCVVGKVGAKFGAGPIYIKFSDLTFRVNNPANRED